MGTKQEEMRGWWVRMRKEGGGIKRKGGRDMGGTEEEGMVGLQEERGGLSRNGRVHAQRGRGK